MFVALFAVGLVVYLQDINQQVATPVFAITLAFAALYAAATLLPAIFESCPYETAISDPLKAYALPPVKWILAALFSPIVSLSCFVCMSLLSLAEFIGWSRLEPPLEFCFDTSLNALDTLIAIVTLKPRDTREQSRSAETPMDLITSRILTWVILNSEDTSHIDVALQAISGASIELPLAPLHKHNITEEVSSRLTRCFSGSSLNGELSLKPSSSFGLVSSYFRALSHLLMSDSSFGFEADNWDKHNNLVLSIPPDRLVDMYRLCVLGDSPNLKTTTNISCIFLKS